MAVYTEVSLQEAAQLFTTLHLGELQSLEGCSGGIENTNYFATSNQAPYVLTIFERLGFEQLPFYLRLMKHLAQAGIMVPEPTADAHGNLVLRVHDKPAAIVNRLEGRNELSPAPTHCAQVGRALAHMHLAGIDFELQQPHLRGLSWWNAVAPEILHKLETDQAHLLHSELVYQNHVATLPSYRALPKGPIHADLFRDNVMFKTNAHAEPLLCGFFDFYFAGVDHFLFDIAVCLNDWCVDLTTYNTDTERTHAFLQSYQSVRALTKPERDLLPAMLRAAALRFWISRLWDWHLPREAALLNPHDPGRFEQALIRRIAEPVTMNSLGL